MENNTTRLRFGKSRKLLWICGVVAALLMGIYFYPIGENPVPDEAIIMVNDIQIPEAEFMLLMNKNVANTYNYFHRTYGTEDHEDFWTTRYGDYTPLEYIKEETIKELTSIKIKQKVATDIGIAPSFTFQDLQQWWEEDNERRKEMKSSNKVVYGPVHNSLFSYYNYYYSNLYIDLKDKLTRSLFKGTESELLSYYQQNKERLFQYTPEAQVEYLRFEYDDEESKKRTLALVERIKKQALNGEDLKTLGGKNGVLFLEKRFTSEEEFPGEENPQVRLRNTAFRMSPGDVEYMLSSENFAIFLLQCVSKQPDEIYPYEVVKRDVLWYYQEEAYENLLDSLSQSARIRINEKALGAITLN